MTISRTETGYNERDLDIGIALGAGMTKEAAADFAGKSRATVYNRLADNADFIEYVQARVKAAVVQQIAINVENAQEKLAKMYARAIERLGDLLETDAELDAQTLRFAVKEVLDRVGGKPTQRIETTFGGKVTHEHKVIAIPANEFRFLSQTVGKTARLLGPAEENEPEVIESEIIHDSEGGDP
jgi:restriction endonuclease Mrr